MDSNQVNGNNYSLIVVCDVWRHITYLMVLCDTSYTDVWRHARYLMCLCDTSYWITSKLPKQLTLYYNIYQLEYPDVHSWSLLSYIHVYVYSWLLE
jgi:hypothetical protein